jgi:hypothetical protein
MHRRRTPLLWSALACLLSLAVAVPAGAADAPDAAEPAPASAESDPSTAPEDAPAPQDDPAPEPVDPDVAHSSEVSGPLLRARRAAGSAGFFNVGERTRPVAPGLDHTRFERYDARGWVRVNALTAQLSTPGLRLDYAAPGKVSSPRPLSTALQRDRAVAGVNGDFFDIGDTGAPLGVGVDRQRGLLHGSRSGWNNTFTLDRKNLARVVRAYLEASIVRKNGKPAIPVSNLNAPVLHTNGIGIYTSVWGADARSRVLPGPAARREVVIRRGRVRAKRKTLTSGPIPAGTYHVVGTGEGAKQLGRLRVGQRVAVRYRLNRATTRVAVSGNVVLLRDGKVLAPGDAEMHPRTAIGIDRDTNQIIVVAVDGRASHSRGLTMKETAVLLKRMGAEDGLNLDGGGSSTMMARESGEPVGVVNTPSDGRLRSVPNGLGFTFAKGSGTLTGIRIEPRGDIHESHRVLNGLSRVLVARGHDESYARVGAKPTWKGSPEVSAKSGPGVRTVATGRRTGTGTVTASAGGATGQFQVRVLGTVHRLEPSVPAIALIAKGRSSSFDLRGYDRQGFGTWVEPRDVRLSFDRDKLSVRRTRRGFTVTSRVGSTSDVITVSAGGRSSYIGVTVGLARRVADRMNTLDGWKASAYPRRASATLSLTKNRHGRPRKAIAMRYALYGKRATRAAYLTAVPAKPLPFRARRIGLWVRGDGQGAWLRAVARDAAGTRATVTLSRRVTWKGWRFVSTALPAGLTQPLGFVRVYAVETNGRRRHSGTLAFDDLAVFTERMANVPATAPLRDTMVAHDGPLPTGGLRVAVLADARISADAPRSRAVARTRRTMREMVAAKPDLVLVDGDLVKRGNQADIALARRVIGEELGGKVPWGYVPGDKELGAGGDLTSYRSEFGDPVRVFTRKGTRFVLLNSARGIFRLGGFGQLVRLRSALDAAAADSSVHSVVVAAHHPTSDPAAGGAAEIADPREGGLVEDLLSDFGSESGKNIAYVGAHARRFDVARTDGVAHLIAGPVNGAAASTLGSFTGWSLLRVTADGIGVEFRPLVDRLRVNAPDTLAVGAVADASATVVQRGRRVRVDYPMNAQWLATQSVHVGAPGSAPAGAVVAYQPERRKLTALRAGVAELTVLVNKVSASRTITVR